MAGTDDEEKKLLGITSNCQDYKYLEPSQVYNIKGINDAEELDITIVYYDIFILPFLIFNYRMQ